MDSFGTASTNKKWSRVYTSYALDKKTPYFAQGLDVLSSQMAIYYITLGSYLKKSNLKNIVFLNLTGFSRIVGGGFASPDPPDLLRGFAP